MDNAIVAGILDTRTGEVIETTTNTSAKIRLSLRVRDELNKEHGSNTFVVFEFNSIGGLGNLDFVRKKMQTEDPDALDQVELLRARYRVAQTQRGLDVAIDELSLAETVRDECLALYREKGGGAKRNIVEEAFVDEVNGREDAVRALRQQLASQRARLEHWKKKLGL